MKAPRGWSVTWRRDKKYWVLSFTSGAGQKQKAIPREHQSKAAAMAWSEAWLGEKSIDPAKTLADRNQSGPTFNDVSEAWFKFRKQLVTLGRIAPSTAEDNERHVKNHFLARFGETRIAAIDVPELRKFFLELAAKRSVSTTRNVYYSSRTFFADAMAEGWTNAATNPLDHPNVKRVLPEGGSDRVPGDVTIVPLEIAQRLILDERVPVERSLRYLAAFSTVTRDGELSGWLVKGLHLDAPVPYVDVSQSLSSRTRKLGKTKTRSGVRQIPLSPELVRALRWWLKVVWPSRLQKGARVPRPDDPVFCGVKRLFVRPPSALYLRKDLKTIEAPMDVVFHETRHSVNSWLLDLGVPEVHRKQLLGHAGKDVTDEHYTARSLPSLAATVARIPLRWRGLDSAPKQPGKLGLDGGDSASNQTSSHSTTPLQHDDFDSLSVDETDDTSSQLMYPYRIAKPSYGSSNLLHASTKNQVADSAQLDSQLDAGKSGGKLPAGQASGEGLSQEAGDPPPRRVLGDSAGGEIQYAGASRSVDARAEFRGSDVGPRPGLARGYVPPFVLPISDALARRLLAVGVAS